MRPKTGRKSAKQLDREVKTFLQRQPLDVARVKIALTKVPQEGRFGASKVFISELWRELKPYTHQDVSFDQFKHWLVDQNRLGTLLLARADLVGAMDPIKVRDSTTSSKGATYHFVLDPSAKEPWEM